MKKLSKLFAECAWEIPYSMIGDSVNYAFKEEGDILYIYFQGSNSITDWVRNFLFGKKPYKDMKISYRVHRGFLAAWKTVEDIIIKKITQKTTKEVLNKRTGQVYLKEVFKWKHIVIAGYSHGGALTFFATEAVWYYRPDLRENGFKSYAFESPRVFSGFKVPKNLKTRWNNMTVVRCNHDLVTYCPPVLFGFRHCGHLLKIKGNRKLVNNKLPGIIKDHYPQVVYQALLDYENNSLN